MTGPPNEQPYYQTQPNYPPRAYPPAGYAPPGYPPPGYPAPGVFGYSVLSQPPRVPVVWSGWLTLAGGLAAAVGSLLTWVHAVVAGGGPTQDFSGVSGDRDGKITVVFGGLLIIGGLLIVLKQGRLWVSITTTVLAAILAIVAVADIGDVSNKSDQLSGLGHLDVGIGLVVVLLGALFALAFSIVAICVRRAR